MQKVILVRHGETSWSLSGKHTGTTDLPLTENGEKEACALKPLLGMYTFTKVFVSPLKRAYKTFELSGITASHQIDEDLREWNYGKYEGMTSPQIHQIDPSWSLFTKGAPGGESLEDIEKRANRMIEKVKQCSGDVVIFSSGHFLRALASRWILFPASFGKHLVLSTGTLSTLGYEHQTPAILLWNYSSTKLA